MPNPRKIGIVFWGVVFCCILPPHKMVQAQAAKEQGLSQLGDQLHQLNQKTNETRQINLNGQRLFISTGVSRLNLESVVAEQKALCGQNTFRVNRQSENQATTTCMARNKSKKTTSRFSFLKTRNDSIKIVTLWANQLQPNTLINTDKNKETPGNDFKDFPRPKNVLRRFSIRELKKPYGFAVYSDPNRTPSELSNLYFRALKKKGYSLKRVLQMNEKKNVFSFVGIKNGEIATVVTHRQNDTTYSAVSLGKHESTSLSQEQKP